MRPRLFGLPVALAALAAALPAPGLAAIPGAPGCPVFPADNVWNTDISALPVNTQNSQWLASMGASAAHLHPDFGPSAGAVNYGIPYDVVAAAHPKVTVMFDYADESDQVPYPFGPDIHIEGGSSASGDRHALMLDSSACRLYELYNANWNNGAPTAGSGATWDLTSNVLRPSGWTSADAAGLPIFPGLLRYDEVQAGSVTHAIRFTAQRTDRTFLWPARHQAGAASDPTLPPMGARFRLRSDFATSGYSPQAQVVLSAMKHYGLMLADNGSNWYFQGDANSDWPGGLLSELKSIPAEAFEAIDESSLMLDPNSGQARQSAPPSLRHRPGVVPLLRAVAPATTPPAVAVPAALPADPSPVAGAPGLALALRERADAAASRAPLPGGALSVISGPAGSSSTPGAPPPQLWLLSLAPLAVVGGLMAAAFGSRSARRR